MPEQNNPNTSSHNGSASPVISESTELKVLRAKVNAHDQLLGIVRIAVYVLQDSVRTLQQDVAELKTQVITLEAKAEIRVQEFAADVAVLKREAVKVALVGKELREVREAAEEKVKFSRIVEESQDGPAF